MGLFIGNQIYKGGATYLDDTQANVNKAYIGYHNVSDDSIKSTLVGTDIKSVHEIVQPGYYRISLGNLRKKLPNTFSDVMKDTKLPDDSRVLIYIPDGYLIPYPDSNTVKRYLGYLEFTQYYPSAKVSAKELSDSYMLLKNNYIPYIPPDRLKKFVFTSPKKHGVIDYSWSESDIDSISKMEVPDDATGELKPVDFYIPNPNLRISVYIEGYGIEVQPSPFICFMGKEMTDKVANDAYYYQYLIYEKFLFTNVILYPETIVNRTDGGYNLPFIDTGSRKEALGWPYTKIPEIGSLRPEDIKVTNLLPYSPDIYTTIGELPADKIAYIPLAFDFNNFCTIDKFDYIINIGTKNGRLPEGVYLFDRSNYSYYNYKNISYSYCVYLYAFEAIITGGNSFKQKIYESNTGVTCRFRVGLVDPNSKAFLWKAWASI